MRIKRKIGSAVRKIARALNEKEMIPVTKYVDKDNILSGKVALITGGSGGIDLQWQKALLLPVQK